MAATILQCIAGLLLGFLLLTLFTRSLRRKPFSPPTKGIDVSSIPVFDLLCVGAFILLFTSKVFTPAEAPPVSDSKAPQTSLSILLTNTALLAFPIICLYFFRLRNSSFSPIHNWAVVGQCKKIRLLAFPILTICGVYAFMGIYSSSGLMNLIAEWSQSPLKQNSVSFLTESDAPMKLKLYFGFHAVIFAPLSEEIIFRGYIYPVLKKYSGMTAALIFTAVLFGLVHNHVPTFLPLAIFGLLLCLVYEKTKTLWAPIIAHSVFNFVTVFVSLSDLTPNT